MAATFRGRAVALACAVTLPVAGAALSGCAVGPDYKRPKVEAPTQHRGATAADDRSAADLPFWDVYKDPRLTALLREALSGNFDVAIAATRIEDARAQARAAAWALAPTLGINLGGGYARGFPGVPSFFPPNLITGAWSATGSLAWELDLWGRLRRLKEAAEHQLAATQHDRNAVQVALVGDLAEAYFRLLGVDRQRAYAAKAVETRKATLALFQERLQGGVGNDLEVARAEANVREAEGLYASADRAVVITENLLAFLAGKAPRAVAERPTLDALGEPPAIPAGLPSTLLERRPDVALAEALLAAATARVGVAVAGYFPRFDLTGSAGALSDDLTKLGDPGHVEGIAAGNGVFSWTLPFLGGERIRSAEASARAQLEGARLAYLRAATNAFREVADALATVATLKQAAAAYQQQPAALERAEQVATQRYRGGVSNYLDVLTAQEQLLRAQVSLADTVGQHHGAVARLYRVLGGGWVTASPSPKGAPAPAPHVDR